MERKIKVSEIKKVLLKIRDKYSYLEHNWVYYTIEEIAEKLKIKLE